MARHRHPVREAESTEHPAKKPTRAISVEESTLLRRHLKADEAAVHAHRPDLVTFMLGTGARIGEALAVLLRPSSILSDLAGFANTLSSTSSATLAQTGPANLTCWSVDRSWQLRP